MNVIDNSVVRGLLAGAVATVPMAITLNQSGPSNRVDDDARLQRGRVSDSTHLVYGAFFGLIFSLATSRIHRYPNWLKGAAFGTGIWALSRTRFASSLRLKPLGEDFSNYQTTSSSSSSRAPDLGSLAAHLIWGLAAGRLINQRPSEIVRDAASGMIGQGINAKFANSLVRG